MTTIHTINNAEGKGISQTLEVYLKILRPESKSDQSQIQNLSRRTCAASRATTIYSCSCFFLNLSLQSRELPWLYSLERLEASKSTRAHRGPSYATQKPENGGKPHCYCCGRSVPTGYKLVKVTNSSGKLAEQEDWSLAWNVQSKAPLTLGKVSCISKKAIKI